jgi:hypothetical protein
MVLRIRQGLEADRSSFTPASGELIYTTDEKQVYVGDGTTAGGNLVGGEGGGGASNLNGLSDVLISDPANGEVLKYDGTKWINDTDNSGLTEEDVQDIVGAMFTDGTYSNIAFTYQDGSGVIDATASGGGGGSGTVAVGAQGRLAYYALTGSTVSDVGSGVEWDNDNNVLTINGIELDGPNETITALTSSVLTLNSIVTIDQGIGKVTINNLALSGSSISTEDSGSIELSNVVHALSDVFVDGQIIVSDNYHVDAKGFEYDGDIAILPKGGSGLLQVGGILDDQIYGAKFEVIAAETQVGGSPIYGGNSMATFMSYFGELGDPSVAAPSVAIARARGTPKTPLPVQSGDNVGILSFNGWDGDNFTILGALGAIASGSVGSNLIEGAVGLIVQTPSGIPKQVFSANGATEINELQMNHRMSETDPMTFVTTPSKSLYFQTARVKFNPLTSAERDALTGVEVGEVIFNTTATKLQVCTAIGPVVWDDLN